MQSLGFRAQGLEFQVSSLGFRVWVLAFGGPGVILVFPNFGLPVLDGVGLTGA